MFNTFISRGMLDALWVIVSTLVTLWSISALIVAPDMSIGILVLIGTFVILAIVRRVYEMAIRLMRIDENQ